MPRGSISESHQPRLRLYRPLPWARTCARAVFLPIQILRLDLEPGPGGTEALPAQIADRDSSGARGPAHWPAGRLSAWLVRVRGIHARFGSGISFLHEISRSAAAAARLRDILFSSC